MRTRSGFTLVELLVAIVILTVVAGATIGLLANTQRVTHTQAARASLQQSVRTSASLLPAELRELAASGRGADLLVLASDSITYRAMRGLAVVCAVSPTELRVRAGPGWRFGYRQPAPGRDSLLLFVDHDPAAAADDRWLPLALSSVAPSRCGAEPALALRVALDTIAAPLAAIPVGAPVRLFEVMQLRLYSSAGSWWLGARSVSAGETLQPLLGPLLPGGFALTYLDSAGTRTTSADRVRSIELTVRGTSDSVRVAGGTGVVALQDSLVTTIRLRNVPGS